MKLKDFSPLRTFTSAKLVNNRVLNRLGLQVARTVAADMIYKMRSTPFHPELSDQIASLRRDGMMMIENFLDQNLFDSIKKECLDVLSRPESLVCRLHGPTHYDIALIRNLPQESVSNTLQFFEDARVLGLLESGEKRMIDPSTAHRAIERVRQGETTTDGDPETDLHSDIFFYTHKAWLYLTDVRPEDAPLVFVKGSHKLNFEQAKAIYRHSLNPITPSRRISPDEMTRRGLKEVSLAVKANTLVVANVCGYHRRSKGLPGGERISLHFSVRSQPFFRFLDRIVGHPET
ncbi:MAG: phytanoyl-CoA dioxygenase family protein [Planctomycetes bacterium]|nr:phytanoyl-CoA dioxygenase family protein [Planctomycetota bacterium]